ncbi:hypothetical protein JAAARDRAFT_61563 [Jaapia argillacea MUCL 33604]|uniref:Glycosyl transferase family 25 domain-containing protein n=1 Tax=Jaapia argillacea MUCL 33604 TaxID=933084 RepID=A0A067PNV4_9AGAM|nr:hypothetical protein JAAARDRAFT_61563 [Jaapia argillacea MUCL 33604]
MSLLQVHGNQTLLPTISEIYVVSLARRADRRAEMEILRNALGLEWAYVDATEATDSVIGEISRRVRSLRTLRLRSEENELFNWPDDTDSMPLSLGPLGPDGSDLWSNPSAPTELVDTSEEPPLTCATENDKITPYNSSLHVSKILTASKMACWHSHLSVLKRIANAPGGLDRVSVILEDDVDMEWDIKSRLAEMWDALPNEWDLLFLGHCWSNETYYPPLVHPSSHQVTHIHPSHRPKCTHAYAITTLGARRALLHLRYPPFAYSRALDQAYAWLVESGRLKAFSVVPSVVVQRKNDKSDIWVDRNGRTGNGSGWREDLYIVGNTLLQPSATSGAATHQKF